MIPEQSNDVQACAGADSIQQVWIGCPKCRRRIGLVKDPVAVDADGGLYLTSYGAVIEAYVHVPAFLEMAKTYGKPPPGKTQDPGNWSTIYALIEVPSAARLPRPLPLFCPWCEAHRTARIDALLRLRDEARENDEAVNTWAKKAPPPRK